MHLKLKDDLAKVSWITLLHYFTIGGEIRKGVYFSFYVL